MTVSRTDLKSFCSNNKVSTRPIIEPENAAEEALFQISRLQCKYAGNSALDEVSINLPRGKLIAICGHSGSGKSTLLNILGLLRYGNNVTGEVRLVIGGGCGSIHEYSEMSSRQRAGLRRDRFGFVLQSSYLMPALTGRHNLEMPLLIRGLSSCTGMTRIDCLMQELSRVKEQEDLVQALTRLPREASGGQRQRISILRALIHDPAVVFADEPCANLDPVNSANVMQLLSQWQRRAFLIGGHSDVARNLILVSHHTESVVEYADYLVILFRGRLVKNRIFQRNDLPDSPIAARKELEQLMNAKD